MDALCIEAPCSEALGNLEIQVKYRLHGRIRDFQVHMENDGLVLRGRVPTYYAKQLAQHAVMQATPIPIRANQIEVY